jgi:Cytochrome c7 and related cytochrome c
VRATLRDAGHLIRPALVLLAGLALFMVVRGAVAPKGFGKYGHYRPQYLEIARAKPIRYAGQDVCASCHDAEATMRAAGRHAKVACEACHGPLAAHADDPSALKPKLPEVATLCARCHEKDPAKPKTFPQVVTADHSGGMACNDCHKPHNPHL